MQSSSMARRGSSDTGDPVDARDAENSAQDLRGRAFARKQQNAQV